jgi:hypothetical protein
MAHPGSRVRPALKRPMIPARSCRQGAPSCAAGNVRKKVRPRKCLMGQEVIVG